MRIQRMSHGLNWAVQHGRGGDESPPASAWETVILVISSRPSIVVKIAVFYEPAVPVCGVFTATNIRNDDQIRNSSLDRNDRSLHNSAAVVRLRSFFIPCLGNAKQKHA